MKKYLPLVWNTVSYGQPQGMVWNFRLIFVSMVDRPIASIAAMVADISETERICHKGNKQIEKQTKDPANNKIAERVTIL